MPKIETELTEIRRNFGTKNAVNANVGEMNIGELVYITDFFPTLNGQYVLSINNGEMSFVVGSFEPDEYLKTASVSGNTLTLTKKDNTTVTFTGEPSAFIKNASVSGNTLTLTKKDNSTVTFSKPSVINNLTSTSTTDALSANQGKVLNEKIPTTLSQLTGDSTHRIVTDTQITSWNNKSDFSGNYTDLNNKPTKVSDFTNDTGFITASDITGKADKTSTVSTVSYDTTNKKITKTINGTTTDVVSAVTLKTDMSLSNVENKSSATIRSEITKANVTTALGYTPLQDHNPVDNALSTTSTNAVQNKVINDALQDIREIAEGKNKNYSITNENSITGTKQSDGSYTNVTAITGITLSELKVGDNIYLEDVNAPDFWVSQITPSVSLHILETAKQKVTDVKVNGTSVISNTIANITVPTKTSDVTNDSGFITESDIPTELSAFTQDATHRLVSDTEKNTWSSKQGAIDNLDEIESGAAAGATALQPSDVNALAKTSGISLATTLGSDNTTVPSSKAVRDFVGSISSGVVSVSVESGVGLEKTGTESSPIIGIDSTHTIPTTTQTTTWTNKQDAITTTNKLSVDLISGLANVATSGNASDLNNDANFVEDASYQHIDKSVVDANTEARHTHSNKSVLDNISSTNVSSWNGKSVVSASTTGTSTTQIKYITINGTQYKLAGGIETAISYEAQSLTETQQNQARENIGANVLFTILEEDD